MKQNEKTIISCIIFIFTISSLTSEGDFPSIFKFLLIEFKIETMGILIAYFQKMFQLKIILLVL